MTIGSGAIWVADYAASSVAEIDPSSGRTLATIRVPSGPVALAAGAGALWVASSLDSTISRIDPARGSIVATIPVGSGPAAVVVANGSVWVANQYSGTVSRIDVERNTVAASTAVGGVPATITSAAGRLWVGVRPRIQHRGGTLVLLHTNAISIDPAVESGVPPLQHLGLTSDGLVTYNHVSGPGGTQLVPDLAITLPTPTNGGTTYTFRLRPGIRYSDGRRVVASDFRREIERVLRIGSLDRDLVSGIVGASTCASRHASACNLGVIADDPAATVTFRLTGPDPQFLAKLANGGVSFPVPPGTPMRRAGRTPIPGTGPYKIDTADRHHIRYVRNPLFREWSHAAQPDGNPDVIIWRFGLSAAEEVRVIQEGKADWSGDPVPGGLLRDLRTRFSSQLHSYPATDTEFLQLNTTLPPFNDARVRRAFNLALDRSAIVHLWGGPDAAQPTCQLLPPGITGYRRYCPYTHSPARDGAWKAPDLVRARRLVAASGTHGTRVTVWGWTDDAFAPPGEVRYAARVLRSLGYRARVRLVTHASLAHPPERVFAGIQVIPTGWSDVTAYNFFAPWLSCDGAGDHGWFCIPRIDGAMRAARARESSAPRAAARLWTRIDREIVDQAALVPLVNPRWLEFSSTRLRNFQQHPYLNVIADQVWLT
jgi:peptide/nickel transport system substrate-binding protein